MNSNYEFDTGNNFNLKEKQVKSKWSELEQKLFLEGIEAYGYKSNYNTMN